MTSQVMCIIFFNSSTTLLGDFETYCIQQAVVLVSRTYNINSSLGYEWSPRSESEHAQERADPLIKNSGSKYENTMAFTLQNSTIKEQRFVIRSVIAEGVKPAALHRPKGHGSTP
ncbi:hypothetical protein TNCV_4352041 [Trichonephila clavipes]|nr:hypothetical protein TNCV_4352041 [Trichonephila clavipes]